MNINARFILITSWLILAWAYTTYAMTRPTSDEIIRQAIITQNEAIESTNTAKVEAYTQGKNACEKTASQTGSSFQIMEKITVCSDRPKPILEKLKDIPWNTNTWSMKILNSWTAHLTPISGVPQWLTHSLTRSTATIATDESIKKAPLAIKLAISAKKKDQSQFLTKNSNIMISSFTLHLGENCKRKNSPKRIILHYTDTDENTTVTAIANSHERRFWDTAYNFLIKADWQIVEARPEKCAGMGMRDNQLNIDSIQIAYIGDGKPNDEQKTAILALTRKMQKKYDIPVDAVDGHADLQAKNHQESLEWMFGSREWFIKELRLLDRVSVYGKDSEYATYMWHAWWDIDLIATWQQESRISDKTIGDGGQSIGFCQIHSKYQPDWKKKYLLLGTWQEKLWYCHELYVYASTKKWGIWSVFHGYRDRAKHISNISIF